MEFQEVFEKVRNSISESCGIDKEMIQPESTLFSDLAVDSIDMVDILFNLESEYSITLKVNAIQIEVAKEMGGKPYEIDGIITNTGLETIRRKFPEYDSDKLKEGISVHELIMLITVRSLATQVLRKIEETRQSPENRNEKVNDTQ